MKSRGYAALSPRAHLEPWEFERRDPGPHDVAFDVHFSGVCHSDIHQVNEDWGPGIFPMVPGHEIVGAVTDVGDAVTKFEVGDRIGVGTFVDSCRQCGPCQRHEEQYCTTGNSQTYNGRERDGVTPTHGGYANNFVVDENYAVTVSPSLDFAATAPLLCAGITLYSPLRHWGAGPGTRVGIVGLGGLGHMGVKFAKALGATTTVFSHTANKRDDALRLGADDFVNTSDEKEMKNRALGYDLIINTVSAELSLTPYLKLLDVDSTLVLVGLPPSPYELSAGLLVATRRQVAGSTTGGVKELQEMMDFCAEHDVTSDIELIDASSLNDAYERTIASDVKYRFVIDAASF